jgi:hypothetical protein
MTSQPDYYYASLKELARLNRSKLSLECQLERYNKSGRFSLYMTEELRFRFVACNEGIKEIEEYLKAVDEMEVI